MMTYTQASGYCILVLFALQIRFVDDVEFESEEQITFHPLLRRHQRGSCKLFE